MTKQWLVCTAKKSDTAPSVKVPGVHVGLPAWQAYEITEIRFVTGHEYDQSKFASRETAESLVAQYPTQWQILTDHELTQMRELMG